MRGSKDEKYGHGLCCIILGINYILNIFGQKEKWGDENLAAKVCFWVIYHVHSFDTSFKMIKFERTN